MNAKEETKAYALSVVAALVLAGIMIGGMSALGYNTIQGTVSLTVTPSITISFSGTNNTVNFMSLAQSASNNTGTNNPKPFIVQNDGNVLVNVTVGATDLWNTSANPSSNYQVSANVSSAGEGALVGCFNTFATSSFTTLQNMPVTGSPIRIIGYLNYTDTCDEAEVEIAVTAPGGELAGAKTSTVTLVSSQAT